MQAKRLITDNLLLIVRKLTKEDVEIQVSITENLENGEYYTNVALRLAAILKQKPLDIAYKIKGEFEKLGGSDVVQKVEVASPGFINFFLSKDYLLETVAYINKKSESFGSSETLSKEKIMVEFTDPNPFKEFHIGHLYSNIVGESISRLLESQGAIVWRVCYQGDVGAHVAKAVYGMRKLSDQIPDDSQDLSIRAQFMGRAYAVGAADYEVSAKSEIDTLNKTIYERPDKKINDLYDKGKKWSLEYFDSIYERLGTKFKKFYFESTAAEAGTKLVREFLKKNIFELSDGAVIFPGEKYGLHNRVFINSQGLPTYEAKEMGLAPTKYRDFAYDKSIIITGSEINEYFKVILKALSLINPELAQKTTHLSHGMVRLPGGKMSSRTGEVVTGEWLLDEAVGRIHKSYPEMDDEVAEKVGTSAVKYALLKNTFGRDVEFSFEESISLEGNSGPYIEYAYVRTKSVLNKYKILNIKGKKLNTEKPLNAEELAILRHLVHFPEIVLETEERLSPNLVALYLFDLAQKFNLFYQKHKIAGSLFRLKLTEAVGQVLKNGLYLLGIETVEKM